MLTRKRDTMMVAKTLTPAMKYAYTHRVVVDVSGPKRHVLQMSCRASAAHVRVHKDPEGICTDSSLPLQYDKGQAECTPFGNGGRENDYLHDGLAWHLTLRRCTSCSDHPP